MDISLDDKSRLDLSALNAAMSEADKDKEEKDRLLNPIVDQEERELWEVRYWRHLLEGILIWEESP